MKNSSRITLAVLIVLIIAILIIIMRVDRSIVNNAPPMQAIVSPENATYTIDGTSFVFKEGKATSAGESEGSSVTTVELFGEPVYGDLDTDGDEDAAVVLVMNGGGSGSFYYVALALNENGNYESTNTLFIGDRIAPQTVEIHDGRAVFNYAERKTGEPMTTQPSIGKSLWIHLDKATGEIGEWVKDFEGEASTEIMSLTMKPWTLLQATYTDGRHFLPKQSDAFILTFEDDNTFSATTDCNGVGGNYTSSQPSLTFTNMMSTQMFCEGSEEATFSELLKQTQSYEFTSRGELIFILLNNQGSVYFK